jgi:hypothetical protein
MLPMQKTITAVLNILVFLTATFAGSARLHAQAALLLEEPYGFFGTLNPTGHSAVYLARVCAETPVKLRSCGPGELGSVIARYQGINGYDWIAVPLVPYLYSVEDGADVPTHVDREQVTRLRERYHEEHLEMLGPHVPPGNFVRGGWTQLLGVAYERRIYAFRFDTTPEQDAALIEAMNSSRNHSHFNLFYNNCADFARGILNTYFPGKLKRNMFPDAWMTTPKQTAYKLVKLADRSPDTDLTVFDIRQVPGYRHLSHSNKSIAESLTTTGYAVPLMLVNPYLAGGLFMDFVVRGRFHVIPKRLEILQPDNLIAFKTSAPDSSLPDETSSVGPEPPDANSLTGPTAATENRPSAGAQAPGAAAGDSAIPRSGPAAN